MHKGNYHIYHLHNSFTSVFSKTLFIANQVVQIWLVNHNVLKVSPGWMHEFLPFHLSSPVTCSWICFSMTEFSPFLSPQPSPLQSQLNFEHQPDCPRQWPRIHSVRYLNNMVKEKIGLLNYHFTTFKGFLNTWFVKNLKNRMSYK